MSVPSNLKMSISPAFWRAVGGGSMTVLSVSDASRGVSSADLVQRSVSQLLPGREPQAPTVAGLFVRFRR